MSAYWYLAVAIVAEVIATSALKSSQEFTRFVPSMIVVVGYGLSFYCLSVVLRSIPIGITYAVWSGVGIVLITLIGYLFFSQAIDLIGLIGIAFILIGVVLIFAFSETAPH